MDIGSNIKRRRYELRMSQQELAEALGYKTRSTIAKIESGENDVSHKKLQRFATVLDTSVEALISGYSHPLKENTEQTKKTKENKTIAIILAGGKSGRNLQNIPNQFISVHGKPVIMYTLETYQNHPAVDDIYIVCLKGWEKILNSYASRYGISKLKGLVPAGTSGILSLKNGLDQILHSYHSDDIVIIQESTRPMVSEETVSKILNACYEKGTATICHLMHDYVQFDLSEKTPVYVNRENTIALQSPEAHRISLLRDVFETAAERKHPLTESCCTMLLYHLGYEINFIRSDVNNIKIMREEDIATFGALVK